VSNPVANPAAPTAAGPREAVKTVNLALQGGGAHGAYTWGVLDALAEDGRIAIEGISGASAGAINAVVFASGFAEGGRDGARAKMEKFWLSVSTEGAPLAPPQRRLMDTWLAAWGPWVGALPDALSQLASPYEMNPLNVNPLRDLLVALVDFERLRATDDLKLFVAATNVRTGRGEIFRRDALTVDHVMASACLPHLFQAVTIDGQAYWDGGYTGNPPLWPLFYETQCRDAIIVQINPTERAETPRTPGEIAGRVNEITFNASLVAELRAADLLARLIRSDVLKSEDYSLKRLHRIGGAGKLERYAASTTVDTSWPFLKQLRDIGREDAKAWLEQNFDAVGVESTLDIGAFMGEPAKGPVRGANAAGQGPQQIKGEAE
jgi:NTE family protein